MPLTDTAIRQAKPTTKTRRMFDGGGLYLEIAPSGGKWWRLKYRHIGKEKRLSLGTYPETQLKIAREKRDEARKLIAQGMDPSAERKAEALRARILGANTFEAVALEWLELKRHDWTEKNEIKERGRLVNHCFPWIGKLPITEVGTVEIRGILDRIVKHRNLDTAHRVRQTMSCVFRYAVAHERAERDPAHALADFLPAHRKKHFAHITDPKLLGELLRAIHGFTGHYVTTCALKLAPLLFLRPGELRQGEWAEVDLDSALWTIPARRMKLAKAAKLDRDSPPHLVPLATQTVEILRELHALTGDCRLMFPGVRNRGLPMSDATMNAALKRMGFDTNTIQPHGFRHTASTALNEMGFLPEAIERQLSHRERGIAGIYNKAQHMPERIKLMQTWADYLDTLRTGAKIVSIKRQAA
ncbi:MAG: integrase arm-type DNA-binding domain-containing protein [Rudaea sp.]|nr:MULTISPECIES: integrase arm-type DNA-binding domain-containing protein [unclassified Rudaea]MBN8888511.1 integrase arm-type DNA-binding domain-containing protein [Rudaea sp.]